MQLALRMFGRHPLMALPRFENSSRAHIDSIDDQPAI